MSTVQLEVLREEAMKEEKEEIERIRKKYKQRKQRITTINTTNQEKKALIKQAKKQEAIEKEQIRQKLKAKQKKGQLTTTTHTNPEKEQLIQQAQKQEAQEKEQLLKKYKERQKQHTPTQTNTINQEKQALIQQAQKQEAQEKEQIRKKLKAKQKTTPLTSNHEDEEVVIKELMENTDVGEDLKNYEFLQEDKSAHQLLKNLLNDEIYENRFERENLEIPEINALNDENNEVKTVRDIIFDAEETVLETVDDTVENTTLDAEKTVLDIKESVLEVKEAIDDAVDDNVLEVKQTVDRSAILAKYNIKDIQEDDVDQILENFDRPKIDENIEKIEEKIMLNIEKSALAHPKIEWVNVLVFFDEEELEGNIKIFAEYSDRSLLKLIIPEDNKKLEVELIQIALYEVWDVLTTLGVIIDDLESKIDVEIELDRA